MKSQRWAVIALALCAQVSMAEVAVVVGAGSPATSMTKEQVASLFLGKSGQLPGFGSALLVDLPDSSPAREQFYTKVTGKSAAQIKAAWSRLMFSGKGTPPKELADATAVKKAVAAHPGTVGYIEKNHVDSSVKVLWTVD